MDQILSKLDRVFCYQDDVLIGGVAKESCQEALFEVIRRLEYHNVQIDEDRSEFLVQSVKYLGHEVSCRGISPNPEKTRAIVDAPIPRNVSQLKAYLGLLNLLCKGVEFVWSKDCQKVFEKSKSMTLENNLLEVYDPNKPIVLATDANVGAVLSHMVGGIEKPVMFISSSLSPAEKGYSQMHREALAIIFALKKLHNYLFGQKFVTLSPKKKNSAVAAARLQRWSMKKRAYTCFVYRI